MTQGVLVSQVSWSVAAARGSGGVWFRGNGVLTSL